MAEADSALSFSIIGGLNIVGLIVLGWFSDRSGPERALFTLYTIRLLSFIILINVRDLQTLYIFSAIFGLTLFTSAPLMLSLIHI